MNEIVKQAILSDQYKNNNNELLNSNCEVCQIKLDNKDFEVLTFFGAYVFLCQSCTHDIMNLIASMKVKQEMKQHSYSSRCSVK